MQQTYNKDKQLVLAYLKFTDMLYMRFCFIYSRQGLMLFIQLIATIFTLLAIKICVITFLKQFATNLK